MGRVTVESLLDWSPWTSRDMGSLLVDQPG
jgi:hypothetical protein